MKRRYRDVVVTRIRTDQGAEGHCFNAVSGTSPVDVANVILEEIAPAIVGVDLFAVEEVVKRAYRATYRYQRDLRITRRLRPESPWGGERFDGSSLELESFLTARVNRLARVLNKPTHRAYVVAFGISIPEWRVLAHLSQMSPCLARDLAQRMAIGKASISRVLRRLHKKKLIAIRESDDDARALILTVLPAGAKMYLITPIDPPFRHEMPVSRASTGDRWRRWWRATRYSSRRG